MKRFRWQKILLAVSGLSFSASLLLLSAGQAAETGKAQESHFPVPVSVNALMVTMIDHSAHYIWDYAASESAFMGDNEWRAVEYYAIQLAAAGPLLTLGGTGPADDEWVKSGDWLRYSKDMSAAAEIALNAAKIHDTVLLEEAGDMLVISCEGCHDAFKPALPTEGVIHDPYYDHLYHFLLADPERP